MGDRFSAEQVHRRLNLLTGEWVLVSPHRAKRPWMGEQNPVDQTISKDYDTACYLCPGNTRVSGETNPAYQGPYVFTNDHQAITEGASDESAPVKSGLFVEEKVTGTCRVICYSPQHNLSMAQMSEKELEAIVDVWQGQWQELSQVYTWVQIFENRGELAGCSSPHPHGQIWASSSLPNELAKEDDRPKQYFDINGSSLLLDLVAQELEQLDRVVLENDHWLVIVPHWAQWPYETLLLPKQRVATFNEINTAQKTDLAKITKQLLSIYDALFSVACPYSMGWHCAPNIADENANAYWQLHAHFYPPLLRSATIKKFMVGYELLGEPQRDMTPELAAKVLRDVAANES